MSDQGPIQGWGKDVETDAAIQTPTEKKMRGKFRQSGYMPTSEESYQKEQEALSPDGDPLEEHFLAINKALERGHKFKSSHKETCAKVIQTDLPKEETAWQGEISRSIASRPLHQCYNGWWKVCQDLGMAQAPHFDVAWTQSTEFDPMMANCDECGKEFRQAKYGQKFCSNGCGAKADKKKLDATIAARPTEHPQAEVGG